jgi:TPR repeat protein
MRRAVELEPGVFTHRIITARLLLACGQIEQARDLGGRLLARSHSEEERSAARSFLASLSAPAAGLARDTPALVRILEARCGLGNAQDCLDLAERLWQGSDIPADRTRALTFYAKACTHGVVEGCVGVAQAYELGEGVAPDAVQAAHFYKKACEAGLASSCERLKGVQQR